MQKRKFKEIYEKEKPISLQYYSYDVPKNYYFDKKREELIKKFIKEIIEQGSVDHDKFLDAGCGDGHYLRYVEQNYKSIFSIGVDISLSQLRYGKKSGVKSDLIVADVANLPFKDSSFELVLCSEVIEHVPDVMAVLKELVRVSKGKLIISTPTLTAPFIRFELFFIKMLGGSGKWGKTHIRELKQKDFLLLLKASGLSPILIEATPFVYFPLTFKWLSIFGLPFAKFLYVIDTFLTRLLPFLKRFGISTIAVCDIPTK